MTTTKRITYVYISTIDYSVAYGWRYQIRSARTGRVLAWGRYYGSRLTAEAAAQEQYMARSTWSLVGGRGCHS